MLLLQAPGSFLVVIFHIQYHENVSTWLPFFMTGIQQTVLLILCVVYEVKRIRNQKKQENDASEPLIGNGSVNSY